MADAQWSPGPRAWTVGEWLPVLDIVEPPQQRRLTVLVRLLLLIPHFVVLFLLDIAAAVAVVAGWFAALFLGRLPEPVFRFLAGYLGYQVRVGASSMLLVDRYPPFALDPPPDYPVRIEVRPTGLNRLAVFFRLILMIPAAVVQSLALSGWWAVAIVWWLVTLILGRMPRPLFEATAAVLRYGMRFSAYVLLLTPAYPKGFFGDDDLSVTQRQTRSATRPLLLSGAGKGLLVLFLVLGVATSVTTSTTTTWPDETADGM
ncbi:hypothetical protein GCM10015535_42730 [Streptomyces gelaticus]|uniref:DUF4389 domain-containing protein n=1 Tax=Streptomyces gelaticus TaxID=285446 RepID=A0ABQ2W552_9ACTN|nr:DUF4389 domain-containing protein [Streptomyces gelaticus]GGV89255.1 hypothetical protein GCM10015535_42730 [Streptomyces gelaticus]